MPTLEEQRKKAFEQRNQQRKAAELARQTPVPEQNAATVKPAAVAPTVPSVKTTKPSTVPTSVIPEPSIEDRARSLIDADFQEQNKLGQELGLSTQPTSLEEFLRQQKEYETSVADSQRKLADIGLKETRDQLEQTKESGEAAMASTAANLRLGREGPVSSSREFAIDRFNTAISKNIQSAERQFESAQIQRQQLDQQLARAQQTGDAQLISSVSAQIEQNKLKIAEAETALLDSQQRAVDTALKVDSSMRSAQQQAFENRITLDTQRRQNLTTFTGFIDAGIDLSPSGVASFASSLGVPMDLAMEYYAGAESIRKDKRLSQDEKQLQLDALNFDVGRKLEGISSKEAQSVADYEMLVKSGNYTPEQIKSFATAMGIPNDQNPVFLAEQRLREAQAKIAYNEANGILTDPRDKLDYANAVAEYNEYYGTGGEAYVPNQSLEGIQMTYEGGRLNITPPSRC